MLMQAEFCMENYGNGMPICIPYQWVFYLPFFSIEIMRDSHIPWKNYGKNLPIGFPEEWLMYTCLSFRMQMI